MQKTVEISTEDYIELQLDQATLNMLNEGGVDNWEWYGDSIDWDALDELREKLQLKFGVTPQD